MVGKLSRSLHAISISLVILVLLFSSITTLPIQLVSGVGLGSVERSWSKSFVVPAGYGDAEDGVLYMGHTQVNGSFTVRSCCGYSTNDIKFSIMDPYGAGGFQSYGVVVGGMSFGWNTGTSEKYEMHFDNDWGRICDENGCHPDPSNPSSHNKTVELSIREVAPATFSSLLTKINIIIGVAVVVGASLAVSVLVILRETRKQKQ